MDRCVASWCHRRVSMPVSENRHWKAQATPAGAALPHGLLITDVLASFPVHFRYVVFHPFLDEILIGNIKGCSPDGVHVSLGFFDDILIPPESLQQPAKFDEAEQVWVWEYETEEGAHDLYMDTGEEIRFRVVDESFVDTSPTGPSSADAASSSEELPKKEAPYTLVGSISEPGLGLLSWWTSS
ncbi:DNA-directed RNA polymerase III subunit RPC8 isoform X3 [Physeter macrocephalus]|uniref:DNA-directed RNA polymerase subunit n=1 Tax=Physeter macrocephalus TaxID=9755 RepID=A0A455AZV3_PHYMC|nr:DNA-directed RNA polymerase III subunit RPC8 isoform X3 [Physeter catodon]|eukprot:XP_028342067.1 DNA-directed RNA polymerase III subunit RPC8 isoform X2 [Physeter catodon]